MRSEFGENADNISKCLVQRVKVLQKHLGCALETVHREEGKGTGGR